jgi:hypothetical protein
MLLAAGLAALNVAASPVAASEVATVLESVPARLPADFEAALQNLELPDLTGGTGLTLYCVTDVTRRGKPRRNTCLQDPQFDDAEFLKAVSRLIGKYRLSPAVLEGKTVATEFYYRIRIDANREEPTISMFPNWGHSSESHGQAYDAPQRYEPRKYPKECLFFVGVATTPVDANGQAIGASTVSTRFAMEEPTLDCIEIIKARLDDGRFIPAQLDGKAVAAIHAEVWGNPEKVTVDLRNPDSQGTTGRP